MHVASKPIQTIRHSLNHSFGSLAQLVIPVSFQSCAHCCLVFTEPIGDDWRECYASKQERKKWFMWNAVAVAALPLFWISFSLPPPHPSSLSATLSAHKLMSGGSMKLWICIPLLDIRCFPFYVCWTLQSGQLHTQHSTILNVTFHFNLHLHCTFSPSVAVVTAASISLCFY